MAHLLEEYAKSLGVKISSPVVKDHFFPLNFDKYITISKDDGIESKSYPYYDLVVDLLKPFFDRANIKIVQLGGNSRIKGSDAALNLTFKQKSFIISNSLVHVGGDGVLSHLASSKQIPTVNLFGNTFPSNNRPIFSKPSLNKNLTPPWNSKQKPSFSNIDPQKQIKKIKAEDIAQSVLDFLDIEKEEINFRTKYVGDSFPQNAVQVIPTSFNPLKLDPNQLLVVRADYGFDENAFLSYCSRYKVAICVDQLIQPQALSNIAANTKSLFIIINKDWDDIPDNYFKILKNLNIELVFLVKEEEDLPYIRNKYFDIPTQLYYTRTEAPCEVSEESRFLSSFRLIEGNKEYLSAAHWKKGLDRNNKVLDTPDYWKELEHFYIYESD
tara:strand:+ start:1188 stop:2336 length:1149 start_codon:yes stop_codon:yes gene_type:complete